MILYKSDYFGIRTLGYLNGSAVYRALLPALFSTILLLVYKYTWGNGQPTTSLSSMSVLKHPYVLFIYVTAFSIILNFRLNFSYQRYWEAATDIFHMVSKWNDAALLLSGFHYQSTVYDTYRPPSMDDIQQQHQQQQQQTVVGGRKKKHHYYHHRSRVGSIDDREGEGGEEEGSPSNKKKGPTTTATTFVRTILPFRKKRRRRRKETEATTTTTAKVVTSSTTDDGMGRTSDGCNGGVVADTSDTSTDDAKPSDNGPSQVLPSLLTLTEKQDRKQNQQQHLPEDFDHIDHILRSIQQQQQQQQSPPPSSVSGKRKASSTTTKTTSVDNNDDRTGGDTVRLDDDKGRSDCYSPTGGIQMKKQPLTRPTGMGHHLRTPSVDIPQPGSSTIKSFRPNPSLDWQQRHHVPLPRTTGLHQSSLTTTEGNNNNKLTATGHGRQIMFESSMWSSLPNNNNNNNSDDRRFSPMRYRHSDSNINSIPATSSAVYPPPANTTTTTTMIQQGSGVDTNQTMMMNNIMQRSAPVSSSSLPHHTIDDRTILLLQQHQQYQQHRPKEKEQKSQQRHNKLLPHLPPTPPTLLRLLDGMNRQHHNNNQQQQQHRRTRATTTTTSPINTSRLLLHDASPEPSLFLQELAHLFSLMSAVAMASLRADVEGCASPLVDYVPGKPFPPVNPDEIQHYDPMNENENNNNNSNSGGSTAFKQQDRHGRSNNNNTNSNRTMYYEGLRKTVYFLLGISRSPRQRTIYNASRPFDVLGGVSDREVHLLQKARGPHAQLSLCTLWLREYISREYLAGSTGGITPPIISRVYQFMSDGQHRFNQCRKVAYIQFPFPHAQLTTFFLLICVLIFPLLYYTYVSNAIIACLLNFTTVACFEGIHEVARELEDPFYQFPNDLPLNNYHAQFNESLISCLYAGFHPDVWCCVGGGKNGDSTGDDDDDDDDDNDGVGGKSSTTTTTTETIHNVPHATSAAVTSTTISATTTTSALI